MAEISTAVRLDKKTVIFPARPSQPQHCNLCHSDLQLLSCNYIQKCLFYSLPNASLDFQSVVELMKTGLSQALLYFYPLAGRLATSSDGLVYIDCNDSGADFIEASAPDLSVAEVLTENVGAVVGELFSLNGAINMDGHFLPLLAVQVTKLRDGIAMGFAVNHSVVDGTSFWHFINSWAQLCRKPSLIIDIMPLHTRRFGAPSPIELNLQRSVSKIDPSPLKEKIFHFTRETISRLKEQANQGSSKDTTISSFQALCAHIWQAITRARNLSPIETTTFKLAVNCRPRIIPPFPYSYFGNAIQVVSSTVTTHELLGNDVTCVAGWLHDIILAHQDSNIRIELDKPPNLIDLHKLPPNKFVVISSSPRFPIYDNDFGWGRPISVRSGQGNKFDGKVTVYPGCEGSSSMDVEICLQPQTMCALEFRPHFIFPSTD